MMREEDIENINDGYLLTPGWYGFTNTPTGGIFRKYDISLAVHALPCTQPVLINGCAHPVQGYEITTFDGRSAHAIRVG